MTTLLRPNIICPPQVQYFGGSRLESGEDDGRVHLPGWDKTTLCGMEHDSTVETKRKATCKPCKAALAHAVSLVGR